jgi:galactofuranose transport system permease protein
LALAVLLVLGVLRYDHFASAYNITSFWRYNSMFALISVDRTLVTVYALSGLLAGIAGAILAAQFGAGQPNEGVGWELFAISAVVLGGTLLTGGQGSIAMTIAGVALLGLVFNLLNFENGLGFISLSAYWQSVIRGVFLLLVIVLQARVLRKRVVVTKLAH